MQQITKGNESMSKLLTIDELKELINGAIYCAKALFSTLLNRKENKKASLIAYWVKDYTKYIENEDDFNPNRLLRYKRGDVLQIEFGFRIGSELGGRHYAVVIDNQNSINSDTISVIPLSSLKQHYSPNKHTFILRKGLYYLYSDRIDQRIEALNNEINEHKRYINKQNENFQKGVITLEQFKKEQRIISKKEKELFTQIAILKKHNLGLGKLKFGTIVNAGQITTVSKMRIVNPKTKNDSLYKVRIHNDDLDAINKKLSDLYLFKNNS